MCAYLCGALVKALSKIVIQEVQYEHCCKRLLEFQAQLHAHVPHTHYCTFTRYHKRDLCQLQARATRQVLSAHLPVQRAGGTKLLHCLLHSQPHLPVIAVAVAHIKLVARGV